MKCFLAALMCNSLSVGKYAFDHRRLVYTNQYDNLTPEYSGDLKSGQILKPNL